MEQQQKIQIGQRIKWLRDNGAETSRSIARHVDVSDEAVRNWIAGKGIAWDNAEKVAAMFKIDVGWIWRGEGEAPEGYPEEERPPAPDPFAADPYAEQLDRIEEGIEEILRRLEDRPDEGTGGQPVRGRPGPKPPPRTPDRAEPPTEPEEKKRPA